MKKLALFLLAVLFIFSVQAKNDKKERMGRFEYIQTVRSQTFKASPGNDSVKIPVRMTRIEYNQRTRAQIIRMSEDVKADTVKLFSCLLINNKIGRGEKTTFIISNTLVNDIPYSFTLDPQSEYSFLLPAGEYKVEIVCGQYDRVFVSHVDPRRTHYVSGKTVYLAAEKYLSDL